MKKVFVFAVAGALAVSSCGTYTGSGSYVGAQFGSILGSAIGGLSNGPRGSDVGTIVGMVGGAVVGAAIGSAADKKAEQDVHDHYQMVQERKAREQARSRQGNDRRGYDDYGGYGDDSGFDATMSGDDRLYDFQSSDNRVYDFQNSGYMPALEIRNARIVDTNMDKVLSRGEMCKVVFEIYNHSQKPLFNVQPTVIEASGNRHIHISPNMHVERIDPGQGIRYTALLKADNRLKDGMARICVSALLGNKSVSKVCEFNIPTRKR